MSSCFKIKTPDGNKLNLLYNKDDDLKSKINILKKVIFGYIIENPKFRKELREINHEDKFKEKKQIKELKNKYSYSNLENYCYDHWLFAGKIVDFKLNHEDKVKMLLDRCGTFLLLGHMKNGMVLTDGRQKNIYQNEIPASCASDEVQDIIYSINSEFEYTKQGTGENTILTNEVLLGNIDTDDYIRLSEKRKKRYSQSKQYKIKKIYKSKNTVRTL